MVRRVISYGVLATVAVVAAGGVRPIAATPQLPPVTVHEWGTFTTVAGPDGEAQDWLPLGGVSDLPCFVETYKNGLVSVQVKGRDIFGLLKVVGRTGVPLVPASAVATATPRPFDIGPLVDYRSARTQLKGTVRMETPVLYFYAPQPARLAVGVGFPKGLFTEWYPTASVKQSPSYANILKSPTGLGVASNILWPDVRVEPGTTPSLPDEDKPSHYYAARATDAAPVRVGNQSEKFLFYRGVASFDVPIAVTQVRDGLRVRNLGADPIPAVVIFTNRGGKIGYRVAGTLDRETTFKLPALTASLASLRRDLAALLVEQGLYAKEAEAMVNTWRDTWFEEGTRVLYIVPKRAVDAVLPLTISPAPEAVSRAFVGRMDVITEAEIANVRSAIAVKNSAALAKYGRLLGVIGERILAGTSSATERARVESVLKEAYASALAGLPVCD